MAASRRGGRRRYVLLVLVLASVTLLTLDLRSFGPLASAQSGVRTVLSPLRGGAETIFDPFVDAWHGATSYDDLEAENIRLRGRLAEIEASSVGEAAAQAELAELSSLLGIEFVGDIPREVARIVSGPSGNFDPFNVEIDRGSNDGIEVDMAVVTEAGLAGRIVRVDRNRSLVQLISDPDFAVGVRLATSGDVALGHGTGDEQRTMLIEEGVSAETLVEPGEAVTTAGGRSRFPGGIPIGVVTTVLGANSGEQSLVVGVSVDVDNLDFVSVVLFVPAEGEDAPIAPGGTLPPATDAPDSTAPAAAGSTAPSVPTSAAPTAPSSTPPSASSTPPAPPTEPEQAG